MKEGEGVVFVAKIVTVHQPNYLPWSGFFSKIKLADCLIIADTFQYVKNSVINRNKIRTSKGWCYLTIPLGRISDKPKIADISLPQDRSWQQIHWKAIYDNYLKSDFFNIYHNYFEELYKKDFKYLQQLNEEIIHYLLKCLKIEVEVLRASEISVDPKLIKTDLMIALLKGAGADIYLSGPTGRDYLEFGKFSQNNIELKFFEFQHPVYRQRYPGFEPNLSAIDLLFNKGPDSGEIIKASGSIKNKTPILH